MQVSELFFNHSCLLQENETRFGKYLIKQISERGHESDL